MTDKPSREEVEALIARLRNPTNDYATPPELTGDYEAAAALTALLALAFIPGTEKTWEAAFEQGELSSGLSWADFSVRGNEKSINEVASLLARLSEVEKALELIASLGGRTLLGPEWDTERQHELGAAKAFEQAADIARAALGALQPKEPHR